MIGRFNKKQKGSFRRYQFVLLGTLFLVSISGCAFSPVNLEADKFVAAPLESVKLIVDSKSLASSYYWYVDDVEIGEITDNVIYFQSYAEEEVTHEVRLEVHNLLTVKTDSVFITIRPYTEIDSAKLTLINNRGLTMRNLACLVDFESNIYQNLIINSPLYNGDSITLYNLKPGDYFFEWGNETNTLDAGLGDRVYPGDNVFDCTY